MWAQILIILLGLWLMISPAVIQHGIHAENIAHIAGPLAVTFAVTACWEVTRGLRWCHLLVAAGLLLAPGIFGYFTSPAGANHVVIAFVLGALSPVRGQRKHPFGGGWSVLWRARPGAGNRGAADLRIRGS